MLVDETSLKTRPQTLWEASFGYAFVLVKPCGQPTAPRMMMAVKKSDKAMGANMETKTAVRQPAPTQP
ncbi:MAG: hypothetical protein ACK5OV_01655, partial [bacterium]